MAATDVPPSSEDQGSPIPHRGWKPIALVGALAVVLIAVGGVAVRIWSNDGTRSPVAARQAQVEANGEQVMPFDQDRTTHRFTKTDTGGVEIVTANDPADTAQTRLIQDHLAHEQELFSAGDFSDPMAIHGMAMPGIDELRHGATSGSMTITYETLPAGAQLTYTATTAELVGAVHTWFDAQLMDHGAHAMG